MPVRGEAGARRWLAPAAAIALASVVAGLAVLQVRAWDGTVNADGVSYLDLGRQFARGDVSAIANGYWSPLYPLLLGVAQRVAGFFGTSGEMRVVLAVNVIVFAVAALAIARLARQLAPSRNGAPVSPAVIVARGAAAGALGTWMLLRMIMATAVTPDALLAVWLCLASADIADAMTTSTPSPRRHLRFGTVLALGYWTKAVFLPVAIVALVAYVLATPAEWRRRATTHALGPLLLLALPLVMVQSWTQGRPSFGETGRLNYRWYVGQLPHAVPVHERVDETRARVRRHEASVVALDTPPGGVLFTAPAGSFAYWHDPSRYEPRTGAPFSLDAQLATLEFNAHWFRVTAGAFTVFAVIGAVAAMGRGAVHPRRLLVMLPSLAMLALYALTHPEGRLGAAAIACVLLTIVNLADVGPRARRRPLLAVECVALLLLSVLSLGRTTKRIPTGDAVVRTPVPTLASLRQAGIPAGADVALVGSPFGQLWAHEGDVHVVASLPVTDSARGADESSLRAVMQESAARGVPLAAVIWRGELSRVSGAIPLAPQWWALRDSTAAAPSPPVARRTTPPSPRGGRAASAPRRERGPAARP